VDQCVAPKGVGVVTAAERSFVVAVGGLAEAGAAEPVVAAELEEVVAGAVAIDYRHS
jgi:hypothetical protein